MKQKIILNLIVIFIASLLSLILAELVLRAATPYPVSFKSNKAGDDDLGYRLSKDFPEIDQYGFRNSPDAVAEIIAIGDSHTYSNNVHSSQSWPSLLQKLSGFNVYNYGVGSYGLLTYHALIKKFRKPETKIALIGLYPANDFSLINSNCLILDSPSEFWLQEKASMNLEWPQPGKSCSEEHNKKLTFTEFLSYNSAIISLTKALIGQKRELPPHKPTFTFPNNVDTLLVGRVKKHSKSTDIENPNIEAMVKNLKPLSESWVSLEKDGLQVGVLILPSRELVIYRYFERQNRLGELDSRYLEYLQNQLKLEQEIEIILKQSGIPYRFALDDVLIEFEKALANGDTIYPKNDDGHPIEKGYVAYANAANKLLQDMSIAGPPRR